MQVSYGTYSGNGEVVDAVSLNEFAYLDQASYICKNFYIPQGDAIISILYKYNLKGITQLFITTQLGLQATFGQISSDTDD